MMNEWEVAKVTKKDAGVLVKVDGVQVLIPWIAAQTIARMVEDRHCVDVSERLHALELTPVSVQEAARVLELAMQRAQIPWEILKRFRKGEPIAALRALAEEDPSG